MKKTIKVIYEDGKPVDLIDTADKTTVKDFAKSKGIKVLDRYSTPDDILNELDNPFVCEDGDKPKKKLTTAQKRKAIRQRIAERNAEIRMNIINKFTE